MQVAMADAVPQLSRLKIEDSGTHDSDSGHGDELEASDELQRRGSRTLAGRPGSGRGLLGRQSSARRSHEVRPGVLWLG